MSRLFQKFKQDIVGVGFFATGLFLGLALISYNPTDPSLNSIGKSLHVLNYCGYVGSFIADALYQSFGISAWIIILGALRRGYINFVFSHRGNYKGTSEDTPKGVRAIWSLAVIFTLTAILSLYLPNTRIFQDQILLGGLLGVVLSQALVRAFNMVGAQVILWSVALVLLVFISEKTIRELSLGPLGALKYFLRTMAGAFKQTIVTKTKAKVSPVPEMQMHFISALANPVAEIEEAEEAEAPASDQSPRRKVTLKTKIPRRVENWELPKLSLLDDPAATRIRVDEKEIKRKAEVLKEKLANFKVTGEVVAARPGPAVTMFEFKPSANVKLSEVTALADDLSLALASESLRILAPIPGRDVVGIETSNANREIVYFKDMLGNDEFWKEDIKLPVALGKTSTGESKIIDLRRMPHLMVAGTTGSGKSIFTVSLLVGLLFRHSPKTLKLIIIDPKQVDYSTFENIPHLALPVIGDTRQAVTALKWAVQEMEKRYRSMSRFGARGLEVYNETVAKLTKEQIEQHEQINSDFESTPGKKAEKYYCMQLPYMVIVLEEFGDLMTVDKQNVEHYVVRLAQKARACGMHLVLAMQSPRKEVVTGLIKTNIPGRIAFKVSSSMDSRVILDESGAERLLAQGDMLFKSPGSSNLVRHHGPFLKDTEVSDIANFWAAQAQPEYDASAMRAIEGPSDNSGVDGDEFENEEYDERYDEILSWAASQKAISASLIQRRFSIGYPRAARLVETFEKEGVVGPAQGSKPRQVLINNLSEIDK